MPRLLDGCVQVIAASKGKNMQQRIGFATICAGVRARKSDVTNVGVGDALERP